MLRNCSVSLLLAAAAALAVAGCHTHEPVSPVAGLYEPVDPPRNPDLGKGPDHVEVNMFSLHIDDSVRSICAGPDPFFKFDSARPTSSDQPTMQTLVQCMDSGPLRGKTIMLVGRTDPRGTEAYNQKLGLERAERVKRYLVDKGIDGERVKTTSLGKEDASPMAKDWSGDRRVEILLMK